MALDHHALEDRLEEIFARQDMLDACQRRDVGAIIRILGRHGITQGQIATLTGIAQGRLSEYKTGKRVPTASSTFEAFAEGLSMPAPARRAMGLAPTRETDATPSGGGLVITGDAYDMQLLATEVGRRDGSVKRREMLELAATIGTTAALGRNEVWERLTYAITRPTALDESIVREMESRSAGFHQLDKLIPARSMFRAVMAHLNELGTLLNGATTNANDDLRKRLIVVAGETSVLAGWWASDFGDAVAARNLYETAERAAREANDPAIIACLLAYRSYVPSMKGAHGRARALLTNALETLPESASPTTESWLAARHAEESAALGDRRQAMNSWGKAEEAFSIADPAEDRVWSRFFDKDRFESCQISTYANIPGKLEQAESIASNIISSVRDMGQKRIAIILADIAAAHLRKGHLNEAARIARDGLVALRESEFAMWLPKYELIARGVTPARAKPPVRAFLEELALTKRQFASSAR
jgi:transcriptional regulator with XRE-family HTH domain